MGLPMFLSLAFLFASTDAANRFGGPLINGDWIAGCDNRGDCRLFTLPVAADGSSEEEENVVEISIERGYAINQPLQVEIYLSSIPADETNSLRMRLDGKPVSFAVRWQNNSGILAPIDALGFVRALRTARYLEVVENKNVIGRASIEGLQPLVDYVDREQYRFGTVGALGVPGKKRVDYLVVPPLIPQPAIKLPPQSDEPPVELAPTKRAEIFSTDLCLEYQDPKETVEPEVEYIRLDQNNSLALVGSYCGGYNPSLRPYIVDNQGHARLAQFGPNPLISPDDPEPYLPGAWWNETERRLMALGRARSIGDCGQKTSFAWNGEKFVTVEYSSMPECRGSFSYVTTYKIDVVR